MKECSILKFRNAMMHPMESLHRYKDMECDLETLTRTKYFAECRAEHHDESIMVYAPITPTSMAMIRCANSALPTESNYVRRLHVADDEMLCVGFERDLCPLIIEPLPEGIPLSEALFTHRYDNLMMGLNALRNELLRHDISINHLHPNSIIVDRTHHWHVIRPYYATRGYGRDSEAYEKLEELIRRYSLSDTPHSSELHEEFAPYGTSMGSERTLYPACEGLRRFCSSAGFGFEGERGNIVIEAIFRNASNFMEDRAIVEGHNHKWGVIDKRGRYIINMEYDYIEFNVDDGTSEVTLNDQTATFDYFGKQLTPWD